MARRLSVQERALWSRVAATVRPMPGKPAIAEAAATPPGQPSVKPPVKPSPRFIPKVARPAPAPAKPAAAVPPRAPVAVAAATLDGGWDRRLRQGDIRPDRVIDLHGHTLATAHLLLEDALHSADGERIILIVTGKGRSDRPGRIKAELAHWLDGTSLRGRIAALRPAHPRHGGGGAFYLILRRRP